MYGPSPDPRQRLAPAEIFDAPEAYAACFAVGIAISLLALRSEWTTPARAWSFILGQVIFFTAPLGFYLDQYVYGSFPTIDKAGSMAHYLDGVGSRTLGSPVEAMVDPAVRLIGIHMGHMWVTSGFDLVLSTVGAFNAQALLYPALAWFFAWWLFWDCTKAARASMVMAFPFGMGLHIFRDLNWYTIEKAAIFLIPLFLLGCRWAHRRGGRWTGLPALLLVGSTLMNVYIGMINAGMLVTLWGALGATRSPRWRRFTRVSVLAAIALLPLAIAQWALMQNGPALASPETFLWERAAMDSFTLNPLRWNRLEVHRSLNVVALGFAAFGLWRWHSEPLVRLAALLAALFFGLSLGPILWAPDWTNPLYMAVRAAVPGFWRVAKPEVFFHVTWLAVLGIGALQMQRSAVPKRATAFWYGLFVVGWLLMVRTHPAYPPMTVPVSTVLAPDWEKRVFRP